ncbi:hypothetical protein EU527_07280 [Candidatus Thorarchaeota archaeon]|nr:MAG: hypothetical protein EU527_07280 [Candidatus Thorarchaeota archaeon]
MAEKEKLLERFQEIIKQDSTTCAEHGTTEVSIILHKTDWVRIFVDRDAADSTAITIDVEVCVPSIEPSRVSSPENNTKIIHEMRPLLETFIEHIKYILKLEDSGFSVDFIENGCLLSATKIFENEPDPEIFRLLCPPR